MKWLAAPCVLILVLGLAACGGSSDSGSTAADSSNSGVTEAAGDSSAPEDETSETTDSADSEEEAVVAAEVAVLEAVNSRDSETLCELSGGTFISYAMAFGGGGDCEEALGELLAKMPDKQVKENEREIEELTPANVSIEGEEATVTTPTSRSEFVLADGNWIYEGSHNVDP